MHDYLIVGAGLFGAAFARIATDAGRKCLVLERRGHTGGNCHSRVWEGGVTHWYGPHIAHSSVPAARAFFEAHAKMTPLWHKVRVRLHGKLYTWPINLDTLHALWGCVTPQDAEKRLQKEREDVKDPNSSFEAKALSVVGRQLYEKFYKGYTAKMWGRDPMELPASLFSRVPVRLTCEDRYYTDPWSTVPEGGYDKLFKNLLEGSTVMIGADYLTRRPHWNAKARRVLYTGALDELYPDEGRLEWRALDFMRESSDDMPRQGCACVNNTDARTSWTRVTEFCHLHPENTRSTRVMEFPMAHVPGKTDPAYPVRDKASQTLHAKLWRKALADGLLVGGRLGDYKYMNMDETVMAAIQLAKVQLGAEAVAKYHHDKE